MIEKVPQYVEQLKLLHGDNWKNTLAQTRNIMLELGNNPLLNNETLCNIKTPVTIAIGDIDKMVTISESEQAASTLPHGKLLVLNNTPHQLERVDNNLLADTISNLTK